MFVTLWATIFICSHNCIDAVIVPAALLLNATVEALGAETAMSSQVLVTYVLALAALCLRFKFIAEKVAPPVVGVTVITA